MNTLFTDNKKLALSLLDVMDDLMNRYSYKLISMAISGDRKEITNSRHINNFLSEIDNELHIEYKMRISNILPSFIYASEEGDPEIYSESNELPDLLVIVDPLDTSELAVRGLFAYTHLMVYSLNKQTPIISIVGDMFHEIRFFYAINGSEFEDSAFLKTRNGLIRRISSSKENHVNRSIITSYLMKPRERFMEIAHQKRLLEALSRRDIDENERGRIGVDFGSIGLCHIAAGFTDSMIETAKGFLLWDLFPGHYILHAAGGIVTSLDGKILPLSLNINNLSDIKNIMKRRQKFIASGNQILLNEIVGLLDTPLL